MEQIELNFKCRLVPYFCSAQDDEAEDLTKTQGYKRHKFETHQRGIMGYLIEAFAAHCDMLMKSIDTGSRKKFHIAVAEGHRLLEYKGKIYLCLMDKCLDEVDQLARGVADDVSSLNWYAYSAARESLLEWVEFNAQSGYKLQRRIQAQRDIAELEWRNIKQILSYAHLFDYPRPSSDRMGYLAGCGITEVPLVLM